MAWDAVNGKRVWETKEEFLSWSGALVTAGDVAFYGTLDGWFKSVNAKTGEVLSKFKIGSGVVGNPITYADLTVNSTSPSMPVSAEIWRCSLTIPPQMRRMCAHQLTSCRIWRAIQAMAESSGYSVFRALFVPRDRTGRSP